MKPRTRYPFSLLAGLPEMRVFWFFLPFDLALFGIAFFYVAFPMSIVVAVLLGIVTVVMGGTSLRAAAGHFDAESGKARLTSIITGLEDALVAFDRSFSIVLFNPAAQKLFGIPSNDVIGKAVRPQDAEQPGWRLFVQVLYPSLAPSFSVRSSGAEYPQVADLVFENPDYVLQVTTTQFVDAETGAQGFVKIIRDRTHEAELIQSKKEFITVASHQLRTPITEISWGLQALTQDAGLSALGKETLAKTTESARTLQSIVEGLLDITKIEEGRFGYAFEETDPVVFTEQLLEAHRPQIEGAGLELFFDKPPAPLPHIYIDAAKLSMALNNLVDNAVKYNTEHGQIVVRVAPGEDQTIEISIKDTGIGIPADEAQKMFTKFFRAANAMKFQTKGTGLGLYIAKNIVQAHGGRIWAESEVNRGTTFHIALPTDASRIPQKEVAIES